MEYDETRLYYSHQQLQRATENQGSDDDGDNNDDTNDDLQFDLTSVRRHFREFLRNYRLGRQRYIYRDRLLKLHRRLSSNGRAEVDIASNQKKAKLEIDLAHLGEYDAALLGSLREQPSMVIPELEGAASQALQTLLYDMDRKKRQEDQDMNDEEGEDNEIPDDIVNDTPTTASKESDSVNISIQILLTGNLANVPLRSIRSEHMNRLISCPGIVISASPVRCRATRLMIRCVRCSDTQILSSTDGPFGSITLPRKCEVTPDCGPNPFNVVPDFSDFVDRQTLKLQEAPECVPTGELPRSVLMAVERSLVDRAPPGTRVSVYCVPTLFQNAAQQDSGVKSIYLRVVGMTKDSDHGDTATFTPKEEEAFSKLSQRKDIYEILSKSVAPSIQGSYTVDIKRALICMMFSGTRKRLSDGVRLRGDINVLLLGDPSTAKSQFLKFVSRVAPIGIYTSGKGSSAAGLTASVVRDSRGEFYLEGGAMVLADGGIVCIDEFDKMRPTDRVAIHEAMEQQTISIAKAGITTVLNSRSSVLAAANPVFGRYDDFKSASENIDLMTTILSRFDLIFLVRDVREEERDKMICRHVMNVHIENSRGGSGFGRSSSRADGADGAMAFLSSVFGGTANEGDGMRTTSQTASADMIAENAMRVATTGAGELDVATMKKFIQYCKIKCKPKLSTEAGQVLTSAYVKIRDDVRNRSYQSDANGTTSQASVIPITVRQLEALVRVSESLAKMRLDAEVRIEDVNEALRLFRVSTMAASNTNQNFGENSVLSAMSSSNNKEEIDRAQNFLRSRLTVGSLVNKQRLVEESAGQGYNAVVVARVLSVMALRGEVMERNQGRLLKRVR